MVRLAGFGCFDSIYLGQSQSGCLGLARNEWEFQAVALWLRLPQNQTETIGHQILPFDDRAVAAQFLRSPR